jgi:hypothetical protein
MHGKILVKMVHNDNDDLDDEERAAVDAIRLQRGRPLYNRPGQSSGQNLQSRPANPPKANNSNRFQVTADIAK